MLVKICGVTTEEAAQTAAESGADFIGFVFAESKRKITPESAAGIARTLPGSVKKAGVFVNEEVETMLKVAEMVGLDVIQLHGDEPATVAEQLPYEVIKSFPAEKESFPEIEHYPCDYFLIDTPSKKSRGGSGKVFDWKLLEGQKLHHSKMILAGGLTVQNVAAAISHVGPVAVDVSSGVETNGEKDLMKIHQFIRNAKQLREEETNDSI